jgi:probable rRNA maturation factor
MKVEISVLASTPGEKRQVARIRKTVKHALKKIPKKRRVGKANELEVAFLSEKAIRRLNRTYRKKDRPTDVLSFEGAAGTGQVGQLALCWQVIRRQAKELEIPETEELERMVIHGVLHLLGYDHEKSRAEARRMFALQEKILSQLRSKVLGGKFLE